MKVFTVFTFRLRLAQRLTFRRWFPVWVGLSKRSGQVIGLYVRVLSRCAVVERSRP